MDRFCAHCPLRSLFAAAILLLALNAATVEAGDFVKHFDTLYNHIIINQHGSIVEMRSVEREQPHRESAINLADPEHLVVPYTHGLFFATAFQPQPKKVLMLGLGGGGFNRVFNRVFPNALLRTVEIDRRVKELAAQYMAFQESDKNQVVVADGRMFVKRNRARERYDWIILDAYKGTSVPPHLKTAEFYREVIACLEPGGVVVANLQNDSLLFDFDVATLNRVFQQVLYFQIPQSTNVIAIATAAPGMDLVKVMAAFNPHSLPARLTKSVDFRGMASGLIKPLPAKRARVMTDDFAPADYYQTLARPRTGGP